MDQDFRVIAIISAYNEEDIIAQVLGHLLDQGILAYLLDHWSTDDTATEAKQYLGRGLLSVERFPGDGAVATEGSGAFSWESILRRKEALARELEADWFIHHDADEFRESPWPHLNLREAIRAVDGFGYNGIDFELLNFWPTHDGFRRGDDVRQAFPFYEPGQSWDKLQIKCWKNVGSPVDLVSTGGHDATFEGRRVFPLRFVLRHYPIRSQAHGERKVLVERRERFAATERGRGWHVQYDGIKEGYRFIRDPATLVAYDPEAVRLQLALRHRGVEELEASLAANALQLAESAAEQLREELSGRAREAIELGDAARAREAAGLRAELDARAREVESLLAQLDARAGEVGSLQGELQARGRRLEEVGAALGAREGELRGLRRELESAEARLAGLGRELAATRAALEAVYASRCWRWTAALRAAYRLIGGR
jgi:glycosyltransferase involved in cell wall biosynthesis